MACSCFAVPVGSQEGVWYNDLWMIHFGDSNVLWASVVWKRGSKVLLLLTSAIQCHFLVLPKLLVALHSVFSIGGHSVAHLHRTDCY